MSLCLTRILRVNCMLLSQLWCHPWVHHYILYIAVQLKLFHLTAFPTSVLPNTHSCLAGDKTRTLQLGNGYTIMFTQLHCPGCPSSTYHHLHGQHPSPQQHVGWYEHVLGPGLHSQDSWPPNCSYLLSYCLDYTWWKSEDWDTLKTQFGH